MKYALIDIGCIECGGETIYSGVVDADAVPDDYIKVSPSPYMFAVKYGKEKIALEIPE